TDRNADGVLITALHDIRWSTGFTGSSGVLLVLGDEAHFVTDGRYAEQAAQEVDGARVHVPGYKLFEHVATLLPDGATLVRQSDHLALAESKRIEALLPSVRWVDETDLLTALTARKTD